ncbi:MAG: 3-hydroxyacyl-CoA dehydrogenase [Dehalococcoidales bacterium]|jgi:3-hydroxybutyryl-CoA dehydrogenase|nr:3-hydroxyacyl-CoA dehydrogenase [Dehalococcoidales bacterium]MDP6448650.1 3-hydroxyacyl-CoA dehydrogenase family protein [Dehalococcoidales bacterium]MDP6577387.1 3-hydroxyacyl-CoA dehydrogenase family protein [Dehalococcoidales bacterium]|tara:strand:- start:2142 stop:3080 length:939 start_codon:yes stop_codon:yes gene_type:complete
MEKFGIERVAVIGAGETGYGIGLEFARFGYQVSLYNTSKATSQKAMGKVREDLDIMVGAQLLTAEEADATYNRLRPTTDIAEAASGADYVVEAVKETLQLKQEIFAQIDEICPPPAILATNTSGLLVTDIASVTKHPERILAAHYFLPAHLIPLVEVSGGQKTDPEVIERTAKILRGLRKKVVVMNAEIPRFIGNRLQVALTNEIQSLIDQGLCTPSMADDIISFGFGRRLVYFGVFKRYDFMGLDVLYAIRSGWGQEPWKPLAEHYKKGEFGMKTGKGFYEWPGDTAAKLQKRFKMEMIGLMIKDMEAGEI